MIKIDVVEKIINVRNGDRATTTKPHKTYKVYVNEVCLVEFTGYDRLWSGYSCAKPELENFLQKLALAFAREGFFINYSTDAEYFKAAREAALAKLTSEERKLLNV